MICALVHGPSARFASDANDLHIFGHLQQKQCLLSGHILDTRKWLSLIICISLSFPVFFQFLFCLLCICISFCLPRALCCWQTLQYRSWTELLFLFIIIRNGLHWQVKIITGYELFHSFADFTQISSKMCRNRVVLLPQRARSELRFLRIHNWHDKREPYGWMTTKEFGIVR